MNRIKGHFGKLLTQDFGVCSCLEAEHLGHKLDKNHFYKTMNQDQLVSQELLLLQAETFKEEDCCPLSFLKNLSNAYCNLSVYIFTWIESSHCIADK